MIGAESPRPRRQFAPDASSVVVGTSEPEVVGYLYGPRGEVLGTVVDREPRPFGFHADAEPEA